MLKVEVQKRIIWKTQWYPIIGSGTTWESMAPSDTKPNKWNYKKIGIPKSGEIYSLGACIGGALISEINEILQDYKIGMKANLIYKKSPTNQCLKILTPFYHPLVQLPT